MKVHMHDEPLQRETNDHNHKEKKSRKNVGKLKLRVDTSMQGYISNS